MAVDKELALGVLNTLVQGLSQAHVADTQFRIAQLDRELEKSKIKAIETKENLMWAKQSEREAKDEYFNSLKRLDKFNIPAQEITSSGTGIIQNVFEGKKANLETIISNTDVWQDRLQNVVDIENDIKQQLNDYTEYEAQFSGASGILNPTEYSKFQEFAMAEDDPETQQIEGLGYSTKYPSIGTAGMDWQYKQLGTRSQIRVSEDNKLKALIAEEKVNFDKDYQYMKAAFTVEHGEDDNEKQKLKNAEEHAAAMNMDYSTFKTLQGIFASASGEDALNQLYTTPGSEAAINLLRENDAVSWVFENFEKRYGKILDLKSERLGTDYGNTQTDISENLLNMINQAPDVDSALYIYKQGAAGGFSYDIANTLMTAISDKFDISIEDLQDKYTGTYSPTADTNNFEQTLDSGDDILNLYSSKVTGGEEDDVVEVKRNIGGEDKTVDKTDASAIFDVLDEFSLEGLRNQWEIEEYWESLLDKDHKNYDPQKAEIFASILPSNTVMPFDDTPQTHWMYDAFGVDHMDSAGVPWGQYKEIAQSAIGLEGGNLFGAPGFNPGTEPGEVELSGFWGNIFGPSGLLHDKEGHTLQTPEGNYIDAALYWKGGVQKGWTLGNAIGLSKLNPAGESAYMDAYNNSMESSWDKLIDTVDAPGFDVLQKSWFFMNEQMAGAYIRAHFGDEAYDKAHKLAEEAGRKAQIEDIKTTLNEPGSDQYVALIDVLNKIEQYNNDTPYETTDEKNIETLKTLYKYTSLSGVIGGHTKSAGEYYQTDTEPFSDYEDARRINPNFKYENVRQDFDILMDMWNDLSEEQKQEFNNDFETYYRFNYKDYGGVKWEDLI